MATISRLLRELEAASRRAAREAARQEKLALRELALQQKHDELVRAQMEVEKFEERISQLTTIHHEVGDSFDWGEIVNQPPPAYPVKNDKEERLAMQKLRMYRPKFFHRMCGKVEKSDPILNKKSFMRSKWMSIIIKNPLSVMSLNSVSGRSFMNWRYLLIGEIL